MRHPWFELDKGGVESGSDDLAGDAPYSLSCLSKPFWLSLLALKAACWNADLMTRRNFLACSSLFSAWRDVAVLACAIKQRHPPKAGLRARRQKMLHGDMVHRPCSIWCLIPLMAWKESTDSISFWRLLKKNRVQGWQSQPRYVAHVAYSKAEAQKGQKQGAWKVNGRSIWLDWSHW